MTNKRTYRKLSHELLGLTGISALLAAGLYCGLSVCARAMIESYCFYNDLSPTEYQWLEIDSWVFFVSLLVAVGFFVILFLFLLGDRLSYIRQITGGIEALRTGNREQPIPLVGQNELTELADAVNYLSATQQQLREQELALSREKEQLIRSLSHDIRTPLTAIASYAEYHTGGNPSSPEQAQESFLLIRRKAQQIRELTDVLLEGSRRSPEAFPDAHLLMEQLAAEFEEALEDRFTVCSDLSQCGHFSAVFDVQQLRRIFDNLSSNVQKYADPREPVRLCLCTRDGSLVIRQSNRCLSPVPEGESYKLGIPSIRRIAQDYGGHVDLVQADDTFEITVTLSDF